MPDRLHKKTAYAAGSNISELYELHLRLSAYNRGVTFKAFQLAAPGHIVPPKGAFLGSAPVSGPSDTKSRGTFEAEPNFHLKGEVYPSQPSWKSEPAYCPRISRSTVSKDLTTSTPNV